MIQNCTWNNGTFSLYVFVANAGNNASIDYTISIDGGTATEHSGNYTGQNGIISQVPKTANQISLTIVSARWGSGGAGTAGTVIANPTVSFTTSGN